MPKRAKPKSRHYRCTRCRTLIPHGYRLCVNCLYTPDDWADAFIVKAMVTFPGSRELHDYPY